LLKTSCHCGAVQIEISELPERLIQCTCSICRRYAALWGHLTRKTAKVSFAPGAASAYLWNDKIIEFYHCNTCGCVTHYEGVEKTEHERLSVNFRMFPVNSIKGIEVRTFDGADTWKFIDD
tara:strand:+ start:33996 stop:34358 length:363 start_codon:yes stop_codon:yes gene_type:complete